VAVGVAIGVTAAAIFAFVWSRKNKGKSGKGSNGELVLYSYDHCPYCSRVKMILGMKKIPYKNVVFANDDEAGPTALVGKKVVPILKKPDGTHMLESMDIVHYIDENFGGPKVLGAGQLEAVSAWISDTDKLVSKLVYPRYVKKEVGFEEFKTESAVKYFLNKRAPTMEDGMTFDDLWNRSDEFRTALEEKVTKLDAVIPGDGRSFLLSLDQVNECDILLYGRLRSISIIKGFKWTPKSRKYIDLMAKTTQVPLFEKVAV